MGHDVVGEAAAYEEAGAALAIQDILSAAGVPAGLFRTLVIDIDQVAAVIEHDHVRAVTLTGGGRAGSAVAAKAGGKSAAC